MFRFRLRPSLVAFASSIFFNRSSSDTKSLPIDKPPDISRVPYQHVNCTGFECLRESSMLVLSASSSFLKQSLFYYSELTQRYCVHVASMINVLEEYQRQEGVTDVQEELWTIYVKDRLTMDEMKNELLRLRLLLSTIDRLVSESIDAGYQTHDETSTQLVTSELNHVKRLIEQNERLINENDLNLTRIQVKLIEPSKSIQ